MTRKMIFSISKYIFVLLSLQEILVRNAHSLVIKDYTDTGSQSPVDIDTSNLIIENQKSKIFLNSDYLETKLKYFIINDGKTLKVSVKKQDTSNMIISSDGNLGLESAYVFGQAHFHWGAVSPRGSEHTLDSNAYAMEIHFVHYRSDFSDIGDALNSGEPNALAVIGIWVAQANSDNDALATITNALNEHNPSPDDSHIKIKDMLNFPALFPNNKNMFKYSGSLTTPTFNEVVQWLVFREPIGISEFQLNAFRNLLDKNGLPLSDNYREIQPLNGRTITEFVNVVLKKTKGKCEA